MNTKFMTKQAKFDYSNNETTTAPSVAIIGGGAAGLMAAGTAIRNGFAVTVFDKNKKLGKKLAITGKGRCNVTNNCDINKFLENVPTNPRFLYSALNAFSPEDCINFFKNLGVPLKTERGNRVFPVSDHAADIVSAMVEYAKPAKIIHDAITDIECKNGCVSAVHTASRRHVFDRVIICTGGKSYPLTGSDGDGYLLASKAGIEVVSPKPSLVPIVADGNICKRLQGLSLKNIAISIYDAKANKVIYNDFGEMLFTHFGISGPVVLSASAHIRNIVPERYKFIIDLKPALNESELDRRLLSDFEKYKNKNFSNAFDDLLPQKMIPVFVEFCDISPDKKINSITREERYRISYNLKHFSISLQGFRPVSEAIITSGGIAVSEINPKTMESKKIKGLYFAGEVIDVDAYTGGFNLQIAFSTAYLAAMSLY